MCHRVGDRGIRARGRRLAHPEGLIRAPELTPFRQCQAQVLKEAVRNCRGGYDLVAARPAQGPQHCLLRVLPPSALTSSSRPPCHFLLCLPSPGLSDEYLEMAKPAKDSPMWPLREPTSLFILGTGKMNSGPFPPAEDLPREPIPALPDGTFQAVGLRQTEKVGLSYQGQALHPGSWMPG